MKKLFSLLLAVVLLAGMCVPAMAESRCDYYARLEQEYRKAQMATLRYMVSGANNAILGYVRVAQATPYNDIDWLQCMVKATVRPVFAYARSIDATVECTYTTYFIDGQYVDVDPLRVIN